MGDRRRFLKAGDSISLGDILYHLESVEGFGGSTVVYKAFYEDQLNQGCRHHVFIKELFPYHPKGNIYRDETGRICCREDGESLMEYSRQNFYRGNRVNLQLLERMPENISGNLNSYEAYGTFYSVLTVHGGKSLESVLEDGRPFGTLKSSAETIRNILDAVEGFHQNGMLHLDISPDNILLLPKQVLLIDYNSSWFMGEKNYSFSEKDGYTAPEVCLRERQNVGPASDLYSVCAVWFRMLTGRRLSDEEVIGKRLKKCFPRNLEIFREEPVTAASKAVQILHKGLHVLSRMRYQSVAQMREDVEELLQRIEGKGISHSAVWESSLRDLKRLKRPEERYLERQIRLPDGKSCSQREYEGVLEDGGALLLKGSGGMGKTRFLTEYWGRAMQKYAPQKPAVVYIPLADYQEAGEDGMYLQRYLLRRLYFQGSPENLDEAMRELNRQLAEPKSWRLVLLLDGLNEAGVNQRLLIKEIERLGQKASVGILVTGRTDEVKKYGLSGFRTAELLPLTEETIEQELKYDGIDRPCQIKLREFLGNPLMLSLYRRTVRLSEESGQNMEKANISLDADMLVGLYLDSLLLHQQRIDAEDQTEGLRHKYLIQHFLPEIAAEMKRRKKNLLTAGECYALAEKSYGNLGRKHFSMAFPEYLGKSRVMLKGIDNWMEWFDYAVNEQLEGKWNLLRKSSSGNYYLIHDNFIEYLVEEAVRNNRTVMASRRIAGWKKACAVLALILMVSGGGACMWKVQMSRGLSSQKQYQLEEVLYQLGKNMGALGVQINIQQQILKMAAEREVLDGEEQAAAEFKEWLDYKRNGAEGYRFERSKNKDALTDLENTQADLPFRIIDDLLDKTYEMDIIMDEGLEHLDEGIQRNVLSYTEREELVTFYQEYLEAYAQTAYCELNLVLVSLDADTAAEMIEIIKEMEVFSGFMRTCPYEGKSKEALQAELETSKDSMRRCMDQMKTRNYVIHIPEWQ